MSIVKSSELPGSWSWVTIADLVDPEIDQGHPAGDGDFPYIDISSIDNEFKRITNPKTIPVGDAPSRARQHVLAGDVLVSMTRPNLNAVAQVPATLGNAIASTGFCVLRTVGADSRLLYYLVQTAPFVEEMSRRVTGALYPAVRPGDIHSYAVPVPPLPEQRRIAAEIEKHFTRLDAAVAALKRGRANLKRYRASVLKAACGGRLVPTEAELARVEGSGYEAADVLLERILRERRERWEADQLAKMQAAGKSPKDDHWKAKYKEPESPDTNGLPGLPEGWMWSSIGQTFRVYVGATPSRAKPEYWHGDIPWVSSGEVAFCTIRETRERISEAGLRNSSTEVHPPGTVLLGMIGEGRTRGQAAILAIPACNNQNAAAIRVSEAGLAPEYIYRFLEAQYERTRQLGSGNNQPALNKTRVQEIIFPLTPLAEQDRIVTEVERRLSVVDEIENVIERGLKRAERLRQSILKRAFEGKLAPQDLNDEPASVLLERIRAARVANAEKSSSRGRRSPRGTSRTAAGWGEAMKE